MSRLPGDDAKGGDAPPVLRYDGRRLAPAHHLPVREIPVALTVNGVVLATLIASPHDLHFLVAGFLRMQGLVRSAGDLLTLSVCEDLGAASVRIRGDVPDRITPTYTSGCGAGISFDVPASAGRPVQLPSAGPFVSPESLYSAMDALARASEAYRGSGGIHSAGAWDGERLLLFAEDIGRHNTIDRIAGQALLGGIDLSGRILVASGRISSEMAAKAGALGISVIASRTSPTDLAVRICGELGITLVPEGRQLFPKMTVEENLLAGSYLKKAKEKRKENLDRVYAVFPRLAERRSQTAETLSGGEQQMVAIGRGLMQSPDLIIFDEPSLGLSPLLVEEVFRVMRKLHEQGLTIFLVEQNVRQTLRIADYCYVMENGRIVQEGNGRDLESDPKVREAYLGF